MTAAAARNPDVGHGRVSIDDEVPVRTVLVLANFGTENGGVTQGGESAAHERADRALEVGGRMPVAVGRVELRPSRVVGDLEAAVQIAGDAVNEAVAGLHPHGQARLDEPFVT